MVENVRGEECRIRDSSPQPNLTQPRRDTTHVTFVIQCLLCLGGLARGLQQIRLKTHI